MGFMSIFRPPAADDLADDEFDRHIAEDQRRRLRLLQDGELEADEVNGVAETHWRARRARWTNNEPRKPGLYFVRLGPGFPTRVVDVYYHGGGWWAEWSDLLPRPINRSGMQFSDQPIEEPLNDPD